MTAYAKTIARGALQMDCPLDDRQAQQLSRLVEELARWNRAYNLTAVRDPAQMVVTHILDSLSVMPHLRGPVADIGSGAGLPGLVAAILRPDWSVLSVESVGKKARFQRHVCRELGLERVTVAEQRVEHFQSETRFATVTCRAFTRLDRFVDLTRHLLAPGGRWVAMKGQVPDEELKALDSRVTVETIVPLTVPGLAAECCAVILSEAG